MASLNITLGLLRWIPDQDKFMISWLGFIVAFCEIWFPMAQVWLPKRSGLVIDIICDTISPSQHHLPCRLRNTSSSNICFFLSLFLTSGAYGMWLQQDLWWCYWHMQWLRARLLLPFGICYGWSWMRSKDWVPVYGWRPKVGNFTWFLFVCCKYWVTNSLKKKNLLLCSHYWKWKFCVVNVNSIIVSTDIQMVEHGPRVNVSHAIARTG